MKQLLFIMLLFLTACSLKRKETEPLEISKEIDCLDCYFYLFDKYKQDYDSLEVEHWKEKVVNETINANDLEEHSVFNRKGGGPMGAHWNSDAPLFCVTKLSDVFFVEINGGPINLKLEQKNQWNCFAIKNTEWINALRAITQEDYPKIYSEENNSSEQKNSQIGVGEILEITIKDSTGIVCNKAFHIAFGE